MALQGNVMEHLAEDATSQPLYRYEAAFTRGEPYEVQPWTPTVQALQPHEESSSYNHVTLECWQWTTPEARARTVVTTERVDPTLDLVPGSSVVRIVLTGPLQPQAMAETQRTTQAGTQSSKNSAEPVVGSLHLRAKRYDAQNQRRASPRPNYVHPLQSGTMVTTPSSTNEATTYEIALSPPPSNDWVTLILTFRDVATQLVEAPHKTPQVLGRWATSPSTGSDISDQWKHLSHAFALEKRQEGLTAQQLYGSGSPLLPQAKTKPCVGQAPYAAALHDTDDVWSVATPPSSGNNSLASSKFSFGTPRASQNKRGGGGSPIRNMQMLKDQEQAVALLVVDLQNDFLGDDASFKFCAENNQVNPFRTRREALLKRIDELAQQVREGKGLVVFCRSVYGRWTQSRAVANEESSSPSDNNEDSVTTVKAGTHLNKDACCSVGTAGSDFYPEAAQMIREDVDVIVTKHWYSAFLETSLHAQLQRLGVKTVVVCGLTTNHSVSATVRSAAKLGYRVIVSSDGTAQIDPSLQPETEAKLQEYAAILAPQVSLYTLLEKAAPVAPRTSGRDRIDFDGFARMSSVGSGDSFLLPDLFDPADADHLYQRLKASTESEEEFHWKSHTEHGARGPLLLVYQGTRNDQGHMPMCRLAAAEDPDVQVLDWSDSLAQARPDVETQAGHSFNFCRVVHHRSSSDTVRFRSDLCLDMKEGTSIAIVAIGDGVVLELKPKPGVSSSATSQKIYLRHNTLFLLGPESNRLYQYSIRCSRRASRSKPRFSLTFRDLVTFRANGEDNFILYGPGTRYTTLADYRWQCRKRSLWQGAGFVACGASSLVLFQKRENGSDKLRDSLALAAAPFLGFFATYRFIDYRRRVASLRDQLRLDQILVRCNWQPLRFLEAQKLLTVKAPLLLLLENGPSDEETTEENATAASDDKLP